MDASGNAEVQILLNRLDNPVMMDKYGPLPGATAQATLPADTIITRTVTVPQKVNLRKGSGAGFTVAGTLAVGQSPEAEGQAQGSDGQTWYPIWSMNLWARSYVVIGDCGTLPEVASGGQ